MKNTTEEARSCLELAELLSDYVDDELDAETRSVVDDHLDGCPVCRADVALMKGITENLSAIPEETPPPDFARSVAMAALPRKREDAPGFFATLAALFTLPRATALVGGMAVLAMLILGPPLPMAPEGNQMAALPTARTELVASAGVTLDGRTVLGTTAVTTGQKIENVGPGRSVLTFPNRTRVTFGAGTTLASLEKSIHLEEGLVTVDVPTKSPDRKIPSFRVLTPNARFTVWGTKFTVRCRKQKGETVSDLEVQEGVVGVEQMRNGKAEGAEKRVRAGGKAQVRRRKRTRDQNQAQNQTQAQNQAGNGGEEPSVVTVADPGADTQAGSTSEDTSIQLGQDD